MSSRLASLLVRDRILGPDVVTAAMGRQVIYGGGLDTALLEMRAVEEVTLWKYLSEAAGLPMPPPRFIEAPSPEVARIFDSALADRCHAVPVGLEGRTVRLLVSEPVQIKTL